MSSSRHANGKELRSVTLLELENWRNFRHVCQPVQRRVILVGPNASGKSNLLDALRFLRDIVSVGGGLQEAVSRRGGVKAIRCLAARRQPEVGIRVTLGATSESSRWEYSLRFTQDQRGRPVVRQERVCRSGTEVLLRPDAEDGSDPERLTQTHLEQVNVNRPFREVAEFLASIRYLHIVPQLVREPERFTSRESDPYGADFIERIHGTPKRTKEARLRRISEALRTAVPQLQEIETQRDERGTSHLRGKYDHWRPQGAWQTEEHFSDGTLRLMGLLWATMEGNGPLLLEEPELSLHPEIIRHLPQMIARVQRRSGRQVILSTHSPDLLRDDGIGLDEVLLLQPGREGTTVQAASSFADVPALLDGGLTLADALLPRTQPRDVHQLTLLDAR